MIKACFVGLALLLGVGLSIDKVDASGCGRAEAQAACAGAHYEYVRPLRRGQIRRAQRRARRAHRQSLRGSCGYAEVHAGCAGVAVVAPPVEVHVAAPCCP